MPRETRSRSIARRGAVERDSSARGCIVEAVKPNVFALLGGINFLGWRALFIQLIIQCIIVIKTGA